MENKSEVKHKVKDVKPKKEKATKELELEKKNIELNEKVLRLAAEMQNMRKRYEEEIKNFHKYEGEELVKKLLPIVDSFEMAIKLDNNDLSDDLSRFLSGFKMIYTNLVSILNSLEIKEVEALNLKFDPKFMDAVLTSQESDTEPGMVMEVLQKGYLYKDKLIRPAMVRVSE